MIKSVIRDVECLNCKGKEEERRTKEQLGRSSACLVREREPWYVVLCVVSRLMEGREITISTCISRIVMVVAPPVCLLVVL